MTISFVIALSVTTGLLATVGTAEGERLLASSSTNLDELARHPLRVLVLSAFWVPPSGYLATVLTTALLLGAVELRVGSLRALLVFAAGHVGATLLAAAGISVGISAGTLSPDVAHSLDVGTSYAVFALAGYACRLLDRPARELGLTALTLYLGYDALVGRTFTDFGHLFALVIGVALSLAGLRPSRLRRIIAPAAALALISIVVAPAVGIVELPHPPAARTVVAHSARQAHRSAARLTAVSRHTLRRDIRRVSE